MSSILQFFYIKESPVCKSFATGDHITLYQGDLLKWEINSAAPESVCIFNDEALDLSKKLICLGVIVEGHLDGLTEVKAENTEQ